MPNRILRETVCTSNSVDQLSWFEEVLFYRLIVNCDDFGRYDGRAAIIKNRLFPLKEMLFMDWRALDWLPSITERTNASFAYQHGASTRIREPRQASIQHRKNAIRCSLQALACKCMQMFPYSRYENRDTRIEIRDARIGAMRLRPLMKNRKKTLPYAMNTALTATFCSPTRIF